MSEFSTWSHTMQPADMTLDGLARLERELFKDHPDVQEAIQSAVDAFTPQAIEIEQRHGGRELMRPVRARENLDYRAAPNFLAGFMSFLIILLPAVAFGFALRGSSEFEVTAGVLAGLLGATAVLCVIKILSTLRDMVWFGIMPRWAIGGGFVSLLAAVWLIRLSVPVPRHESGGAVAVAVVGAAVVAGFAVLVVVRDAAARAARKTERRPTQPAIDAYLGEVVPKYDRALAAITAAVGSIEVHTRARLKRERDAAVGNLAANRGLYQGAVPLFMNKKELGEFALFAVAEPLLGGGSYPKRGKVRFAGRAS